MLSGSFDWTIKMWNLMNDSLIYTFKSHQNPITDISFNNKHPAMFASSDSSGYVNVINMYKNCDEPIWSKKFEGIVFNSKWSLKGRSLAISDSEGKIEINKFRKQFFSYEQEELRVFEMALAGYRN